MIYGIGTDLLRIDRIRTVSANPEDPFIQRTYTKSERREAMKRSQPLYYYATRFAGKEAVFKALRIASEGVDLSEIEILNDANGAPFVTLHGALAQMADERRLTIHISLSYEKEEASAFAVAETDNHGET